MNEVVKAKLERMIESQKGQIEFKTRLLEEYKEHLKEVVNSGDNYRISTFAGSIVRDIETYVKEIRNIEASIIAYEGIRDLMIENETK